VLLQQVQDVRLVAKVGRGKALVAPDLACLFDQYLENGGVERLVHHHRAHVNHRLALLQPVGVPGQLVVDHLGGQGLLIKNRRIAA